MISLFLLFLSDWSFLHFLPPQEIPDFVFVSCYHMIPVKKFYLYSFIIAEAGIVDALSILPTNEDTI